MNNKTKILLTIAIINSYGSEFYKGNHINEKVEKKIKKSISQLKKLKNENGEDEEISPVKRKKMDSLEKSISKKKEGYKNLQNTFESTLEKPAFSIIPEEPAEKKEKTPPRKVIKKEEKKNNGFDFSKMFSQQIYKETPPQPKNSEIKKEQPANQNINKQEKKAPERKNNFNRELIVPVLEKYEEKKGLNQLTFNILMQSHVKKMEFIFNTYLESQKHLLHDTLSEKEKKELEKHANNIINAFESSTFIMEFMEFFKLKDEDIIDIKTLIINTLIEPEKNQNIKNLLTIINKSMKTKITIENLSAIIQEYRMLIQYKDILSSAKQQSIKDFLLTMIIFNIASIN